VPQTSEKIVLSPVRASDFAGELDDLSDALREALPDIAVEVRNPLERPPGALPTGITELLSVILPFAGGYAFDTVADIIMGRLRSALKRGGDAQPKKVVQIYGPSGEILRRVQIPDDGEFGKDPKDPPIADR
jgi:hypothetical protein